MSKDWLAEVKERVAHLDERHYGDWVYDPEERMLGMFMEGEAFNLVRVEDGIERFEYPVGQFIANAPGDVRRMIAEIERLREFERKAMYAIEENRQLCEESLAVRGATNAVTKLVVGSLVQKSALVKVWQNAHNYKVVKNIVQDTLGMTATELAEEGFEVTAKKEGDDNAYTI